MLLLVVAQLLLLQHVRAFLQSDSEEAELLVDGNTTYKQVAKELGFGNGTWIMDLGNIQKEVLFHEARNRFDPCRRLVIDTADNVVKIADTLTWCNLETQMEKLEDWFNKDKSWSTVWRSYFGSKDFVRKGDFLLKTIDRLIFATISIMLNCYILWYHFTTPPHPKFLVIWKKRLCIYVHVISGSTEVVVPLIVFVTLNQELGRTCMFVTLVAEFFHGMSAYYMFSETFGQKNLMVPTYWAAITMKMFMGLWLLWTLVVDEPVGGYKSQVERLWSLWACHQTYAWVRFFWLAFTYSETMEGNRYTGACIMAAIVALSQAYGMHVVYFFVLSILGKYIYTEIQTRSIAREFAKGGNEAITASIRATHLESHWDESDRGSQLSTPEMRERARTILKDLGIDVETDEYRDKSVSSLWNEIDDTTKATLVFKMKDVDGNGTLALMEVVQFLSRFGVSRLECETILSKYYKESGDNDDTITVKEFQKYFKVFWDYLAYFMVFDIHFCARSNRGKLKRIAKYHCPFGNMNMSRESTTAKYLYKKARSKAGLTRQESTDYRLMIARSKSLDSEKAGSASPEATKGVGEAKRASISKSSPNGTPNSSKDTETDVVKADASTTSSKGNSKRPHTAMHVKAGSVREIVL